MRYALLLLYSGEHVGDDFRAMRILKKVSSRCHSVKASIHPLSPFSTPSFVKYFILTSPYKVDRFVPFQELIVM